MRKFIRVIKLALLARTIIRREIAYRRGLKR